MVHGHCPRLWIRASRYLGPGNDLWSELSTWRHCHARVRSLLSKETQYLVWKAGLPTYRLNDTDGNTYVLQGYKVAEEDLPGPNFKNLPEGWVYYVENPAEDLIFNLTTANAIPATKDEFDQIYIRIPVSNDTTTDPGRPPTATPPPSTTSAAAHFVGAFAALILSVFAVGGLI